MSSEISFDSLQHRFLQTNNLASLCPFHPQSMSQACFPCSWGLSLKFPFPLTPSLCPCLNQLQIPSWSLPGRWMARGLRGSGTMRIPLWSPHPTTWQQPGPILPCAPASGARFHVLKCRIRVFTQSMKEQKRKKADY